MELQQIIKEQMGKRIKLMINKAMCIAHKQRYLFYVLLKTFSSMSFRTLLESALVWAWACLQLRPAKAPPRVEHTLLLSVPIHSNTHSFAHPFQHAAVVTIIIPPNNLRQLLRLSSFVESMPLLISCQPTNRQRVREKERQREKNVNNCVDKCQID